MKTKIAAYSLLIGIIGVGTAIYRNVVHGDAITLTGLITIVLFIPVAGFLIWLRWDWAEPRGRKIRAERALRKAAKEKSDANI